MGENVGRLFYGIKIDPDAYYRLIGQEAIFKRKPSIPGVGPFCHSIPYSQQKNEEFEAICPYETEEYFVIIRATNIKTWNQSLPLGKTISETDPNWDERLKWACNEYGIPWSEPQWYLVGHYN